MAQKRKSPMKATTAAPTAFEVITDERRVPSNERQTAAAVFMNHLVAAIQESNETHGAGKAWLKVDVTSAYPKSAIETGVVRSKLKSSLEHRGFGMIDVRIDGVRKHIVYVKAT